MFGHLTQPKNDSWLRIFADSFVCILIIAVAVVITGCMMRALSLLNRPDLATIYIPCFVLCCFPAAFYARYQSRFAFAIWDAVWWLPTFLYLGLALDFLGNSF